MGLGLGLGLGLAKPDLREKVEGRAQLGGRRGEGCVKVRWDHADKVPAHDLR